MIIPRKYTLYFCLSMTVLASVFTTMMQKTFSQMPVTPSIAATLGIAILSFLLWNKFVEQKRKFGILRAGSLGLLCSCLMLPIGYSAFAFHMLASGELKIDSLSKAVEVIFATTLLGPFAVLVWFAWPFVLLATLIGCIFGWRRSKMEPRSR